MTCEEAQETFAWYWDLAADDPARQAVDQHAFHCVCCQEELRLWEESRSLVRALGAEQEFRADTLNGINHQVMDRINREQSWLTPLRRKSRAFTGKLRRKTVAATACAMLFFLAGLFYLITGGTTQHPAEQIIQMPGILDGSGATTVSAKFYENVPMASISDPIMLHGSPSISPYLVAMSLAALLMTLLAMNWLLRTRT
ncbi:hypothetical protein [Paenibacillus daejeonensis]|uniref:hypothetical protein n=1 Tax=Paenibacillus daejeonensis TaxID=135193 RepID=UPI00038217B1|nr:hypothetical protein [Paenibacillus daejeonensis]